jgi:hypothetical protein
MEKQEIDALVQDCIRYISASKLPTPFPTNPPEYAEWREARKLTVSLMKTLKTHGSNWTGSLQRIHKMGGRS